MVRAYVYGGLVLIIAIGAWLFWSQTHPDPAMARARTEQAERLQVDPPPQPTDEAADDSANATRLQSLRAMQQQLAGAVDAYCAKHAAMPPDIAALELGTPPSNPGVDRIELRAGGLEYHVPASEIIQPGVIRFEPVLDAACPREWRCTSKDYDRIARWLPECRYAGAD